MFRDEFDHYDLSEFTEEQLHQFDLDATNKLLHHHSELQQDPPTSGPSHGSLGGGPALTIAFESLTDAFPVEEIPRPSANAVMHYPLLSASPNLQFAKAHMSRRRLPRYGKNPYEQFRSWKKGFSVTDLVSPIWCEVQYEYGLYGARHRPLERRPSSFMSRHGKEIHLQQKIAKQNDRTLKRGASIHKTLERELRPEAVPVRIATDEERWALRLFNLTAGLEQLVSDGRTRELPVFGVTHGHVVVGIIDEVTRCVPSEYHSQNKRSPVSSGSSPAKKKQQETRISEQLPPENIHDVSVTGNKPNHLSPTFYDLTIIDYKTRRTPSLPSEEDTVSSRLQLMLYHRLLTGLLLPETFDFDALWAKQGINPHKSFSRPFVEDIGWPVEDLSELHVNLCSMVAVWVSVVHSARTCGEPLRGVCSELQIIYRQAGVENNPSYHREKKSEFENEASENPLEAAARQEDLDIAHAIEESLRQLDQDIRKASSQAVVYDTKGTHVPHSKELMLDGAIDPKCSAPDNVKLNGAVQDSLPTCSNDVAESKVRPTDTEGPEGLATLVADRSTILERNKERIISDRNGEISNDEDNSGLSMILGTKKFPMDDERLDTHLADVLKWWFGVRPPRGVELAQSGRCFTCEYQDGCEWREQKAYEAIRKA